MVRITEKTSNDLIIGQYRLIIESLDDVIHVIDDNFIINYINPAFEEFVEKYGITYNVIGKYVKDVFPFLSEKVLDEYKYVFETGKTLRTQEENFIKGKKSYTEIIKIPLQEKGETIQIITVIRDITESINFQEKLNESEKKYKKILESSTDFIFITNEDGIIEYMNRLQPGFELENVIGKPIYDFIPYEYHNIHQKNIEKVFRTGKIEKIVVKAKVSRDTDGWYENNLIPIKKEGKIISLMFVAKEITEIKAAELKIKESEEKYRLITENANDLICVVNSRFRYEFINEQAYLNVLGYKKEDLLGKKILAFTHPDETNKIAKEIFKGLVGGKGTLDIRFRHKSGNYIWLSIRGSVFQDSKGKKKAIFISRDITKEKLMKERLLNSEQKFKDAFNRSQFYKDLFAHDINNILQTILTSSELARLHLDNPKEIKETKQLLKMIKEQVIRGSNLISNVQKLSTLEESEIQFKNVEIFKFLKRSIRNTVEVFKDKIVIVQIDSHYQSIQVKANDLLMDVFENILFNAVKYNENDTIEILLRIFKERLENKTFVRMEFIDNGRGIEDSRKKYIFLRGNFEKKSPGGMGLGLSLVKKIIESYDGQIWVENRVENDYSKGSKFVILLLEGDSH